MKFNLMAMTIVAAIAVVEPAAAIAPVPSVTYTFEFTDIIGFRGGSFPNFGFAFTTPGYVDFSSVQTLSAPLNTSLGYQVNNFGLTRFKTFGFFNSGGVVGSNFVQGTDQSFTVSFGNSEGYFASPTVQTGLITFFTGGGGPGASNFFQGGARLTITDNSVAAIPEPSSWALLIAGFGLTGAAMRKRRLTRANA